MTWQELLDELRKTAPESPDRNESATSASASFAYTPPERETATGGDDGAPFAPFASFADDSDTSIDRDQCGSGKCLSRDCNSESEPPARCPRERLRDTYAEDAEADEDQCDDGDLHLLHTESEETVEQDAICEPEAVPSDPYPGGVNWARAVLLRAGLRLMQLGDGTTTVGIWADQDGPEVRAALRVFGSDQLPLRYLDGDVPPRFKTSRVSGEPVPASVLSVMERAPAEPWVVRDKMLTEMGWCSNFEAPRIDPMALDVWGWLCDFERNGFAAKAIGSKLFPAMTKPMQQDVVRIVPELMEWLLEYEGAESDK